MKKEPKNQNSDQGNFSIKGGQVFLVNEAEHRTENFNERIGQSRENEDMNEEEQRSCELIHPILPIIQEIDNLQKMTSLSLNYIQEQEDINKSEKHQPEDKEKSEDTKETKNEIQFQQEGRLNYDNHANLSQSEDQLKDYSNSEQSDKGNQYVDADNQNQSNQNLFSGIAFGQKTKQNNSIKHAQKDKKSLMRDEDEEKLEMEQKQRKKNRAGKTKKISKKKPKPEKNAKPKQNHYQNSIQFQTNQILQKQIVKHCNEYHHSPCELCKQQSQMKKSVQQKFPFVKQFFKNKKRQYSFPQMMKILEWDLSLSLQNSLQHSEQARIKINQQLWKKIFDMVQLYRIIDNAKFRDKTIEEIRQKEHKKQRQWEIAIRLKQLKLQKKPKPASLYRLLYPQGKKTQTNKFQSFQQFGSKLAGNSTQSPNSLGNQEDLHNNKSEQQKIVTENPNGNNVYEASNGMDVVQEDYSMAEQASNTDEQDEIYKSLQDLIYQTSNRQDRIHSLRL